MNIHLITTCYNEEKMLPYFLKHYSFCDLITVYDNESTDKSLKIINSYPNTEVISFSTGDKFDELTIVKIKNDTYKLDRSYDWVIICDIDEFLYHPNLLQKLDEYKDWGVTVPLTEGFNMFTDKFSKNKYPIHKILKRGKYAENYCKSVIFSPKVDINYDIGCHTCNPQGEVYTKDERELKVLHWRYPSYKYFIKKRKLFADRLSENNIKNNWGTQSYITSKMTKREYNEIGKTMDKIL